MTLKKLLFSRKGAIVLFGVVALAVMGVSGTLALRANQAENKGGEEAPPTVPVSRGDVPLTVSAPGQLSGARTVRVEAGVSAELEEVLVQEGEAVRAGQVLARLGDRQRFETALAEAEATLLEAQTKLAGIDTTLNLNQARLDLLKAQQEYENANLRLTYVDNRGAFQETIDKAKEEYQNAVREVKTAREKSRDTAAAQKRLDKAITELNALLRQPKQEDVTKAHAEAEVARIKLEQAKAKVTALENGQDDEQAKAQSALKIAQAKVADAKADLAALEVRAPVDGVVTEIEGNPGQQVQESGLLISLTNLEKLEAATTVVEEDLPLVKVGQKVRLFFDALPEVEMTGKVARIVPKRAQSDRAVYAVYISLDETQAQLIPGMTVDASIIIDQRENVLRLPRSAARARADGSAEVTVWRNGASEKRTIQVGLRGDTYVEILSGCKRAKR